MREPLKLLAPAKINLFLELKSKRADGFHELDTVMSCVSLYDVLHFQPSSDGTLSLSHEGTDEGMPIPEENLITKALLRLREFAGVEYGMSVHLAKGIPIQAGLGGASSDAATTLLAANHLWKTGLNQNQLSEIAAELGSDIPFFITGGLAQCLGRGEQVNPLNMPCPFSVLIAQPPIGLSTPQVFSKCQIPSRPMSGEPLIQSIRTGNVIDLQSKMVNRLEPAASQLTPWVARMKNQFDQLNCLAHQLSGSGSCYFGLFSNRKLLRNAAARLLQREPDLALYCGSLIGRLAHHFPDFCVSKNLTSPLGME